MDEIALTKARRLTERIRLMALTVGENIDKLKTLVTEAKESEAHLALGYASWTAYLADVLGETPMRLERDVRQSLVAELHGQGMSTRAIAPIVGTSHKTIVKDLQAQVVPEVPPADPDSYWSPDESFVGAHPITGEVIASEPAPAPTTTGLDGKQYPKPATKPKPTRDENPSSDLTLVNDIRLYLRQLASSPQVFRLTPAGKQHIIDALNDTITQIERH